MGADVVAADFEFQQGIAAVEQAHQFDNPFTRHDHRMVRQFLSDIQRADRQAVPVCGDSTQHRAAGFKQHAV